MSHYLDRIVAGDTSSVVAVDTAPLVAGDTSPEVEIPADAVETSHCSEVQGEFVMEMRVETHWKVVVVVPAVKHWMAA